MGIKLAAASGGTVELVPTNTASNFTATVPARTGNVAIDGPAFSAWLSGSQTLSSATLTKLQVNTEEFDTSSNYNNTGSTVGGVPAYSFLPTVAGYYQVNGRIQIGASNTQVLLALYKNGASFKDLANNLSPSLMAMGSCLVYLNGSTDYIELYGYFGTGQVVQNANAGITYFQAYLARAA